MSRLSKKKQIWKEQFGATKTTSVSEVLQIVTTNQLENFDASIDLAFNLNLDLKKPGHLLKGVLTLPFPRQNGLKICVLTEKFLPEAQEAKPTLIGGTQMISEIAKTGKLPFDLLLATPEMMPQLNKIAKILGPKKLMPSAKTQTLGKDVLAMVKSWKGGQFLYSVDENGVLHLSVGKVSDAVEKLLANIRFCHQQVIKIKPSGVKGTYIKSITLSTTMGSSFKLTEFFN